MQSLDFARRQTEIQNCGLIHDVVFIIQDYLGYAMEVTQMMPYPSRAWKGIIGNTMYWTETYEYTNRLYANDRFLAEFEQRILEVRKVNEDWILIRCTWSSLLFHPDTRIYLGTVYDIQCCNETVFFTQSTKAVMHDEIWTVKSGQIQFVRNMPYRSRLLKFGNLLQFRTPNGYVQLLHDSLPMRQCQYIYECNHQYYLIHNDSVCDWNDQLIVKMDTKWFDIFAQHHLILLIGVKSYVLNLMTRSVHKCDIPWTINVADGFMYCQNRDGVAIYS